MTVKRLILTITATICIFFLFFNIYSIAMKNLEDWKYSKSIYLKGSSKYKAIYLDEDIYLHSQNNLADLRIVNNKGDFIPYYIEPYKTEPKSPPITYNTVPLSNYSLANSTFFQFMVTPSHENTLPKGNVLTLSLNDRTTLSKVDVYGGHEIFQWNYLASSSLYEVGNFSKTTIPLGKTYDYKYYQIRFPRDRDSSPIQSVQLQYDPLLDNHNIHTVQLDNYSVKHDTNSTTIKMAMPKTNQIKLKSIRFNIAGDYVRDYTLQTKEGLTLEGRIYNLELKGTAIRSTEIEFPELISTPLITVTFENRDDIPLTIHQIYTTYVTDKLVFEPEKNSENTSYRLLFGNPTVSEPMYDFRHYQELIDQNNQTVCNLGLLTPKTSKENLTFKDLLGNFPIIHLFFMLSIFTFMAGWIGNKKIRRKKRRYKSF